MFNCFSVSKLCEIQPQLHNILYLSKKKTKGIVLMVSVNSGKLPFLKLTGHRVSFKSKRLKLDNST